MFQVIQNIWNKNGFEIVIVLCIIFFILLAIYRKGKKGTWSSTYNYNKSSVSKQKDSFKKPPKESSGERECRRVLQKIFNKPFSNQRPDFLNNPVTGGRFNLELDCYEESLRLALEYNGVQHYKFVPYFHKNKEAFYNQKYRDDMKRRICKDNKINLIEVPNTVNIDKIEGFIMDKLYLFGYLR
jgi:hypothetical protein